MTRMQLQREYLDSDSDNNNSNSDGDGDDDKENRVCMRLSLNIAQIWFEITDAAILPRQRCIIGCSVLLSSRGPPDRATVEAHWARAGRCSNWTGR